MVRVYDTMLDTFFQFIDKNHLHRQDTIDRTKMYLENQYHLDILQLTPDFIEFETQTHAHIFQERVFNDYIWEKLFELWT